MTEIDWTKPIELMDGAPRNVKVMDTFVWIDSPDGYSGFHCDHQGRIGGVQVVRNRKEKVKHDLWVAVAENGRPLTFGGYLVDGVHLKVWCDESGKTRVEVVDE